MLEHGCWQQIYNAMIAPILLLALSTFVSTSSTANVINNFCRRTGHSSVLKNNTIYINGGLETLTGNGPKSVTSGVLKVVLQIDMNQSWDTKTNISFTQVPKAVNEKATSYSSTLNVHDGALFAGRTTRKDLWQFGGTTGGFNTSASISQESLDTTHGLWRYDRGSKKWSVINTAPEQIVVPSNGSVAESSDLGLGFYLGGFGGPASDTRLSGMVVVDTDTGKVANLTVGDGIISNRRGARMIYIPMYGTAGIVLLMGGRQEKGLIGLDQIGVFDVGSLWMDSAVLSSPTRNTWYLQNTTGEIPGSRRDFCLSYATAQDNSSTNVYLYGGKAPDKYYDDVYILSLPSFTWTKVYQGDYPRWTHTCHRLGANQMLSIGGLGNSTNLTSSCDSEKDGISVLDMSAITWGTFYEAATQSYLVPQAIISNIGGNRTGGATKQQPEKGWTNANFGTVMATRNSLTPDSTVNNGKVSSHGKDQRVDDKFHFSPGIIAGVTSGIAVLFILSCVLGWILSRRQKGFKRLCRTKDQRPRIHEAGGSEKHELSSDGQERSELGGRQRLELSCKADCEDG